MELEDAILSTLKEIEEKGKSQLLQPKKQPFEVKEKRELNIEYKESTSEEFTDLTNDKSIDSEEAFLLSTRERLLVLFEGFQAPNNKNIEAKIDLTLNFLEYMLASVDNRIEKIKRGIR